MIKGIIYIIKNNINDKVYIGQTIQPLKDRFSRHCATSGTKLELNMPIKRAIAKYGKENFCTEILFSGLKSELDKMEVYYIGLYDSYKNGYNATIGGVFGGRECILDNSKLDEISNMYESGMTLLNISKIYNVDKKTISTFLKKNGVHIRTTVDMFPKNNVPKEKLVELLNLNLTQKEISVILEVNESYIPRLINKYNLQRIKNLHECSDPTFIEG